MSLEYLEQSLWLNVKAITLRPNSEKQQGQPVVQQPEQHEEAGIQLTESEYNAQPDLEHTVLWIMYHDPICIIPCIKTKAANLGTHISN